MRRLAGRVVVCLDHPDPDRPIQVHFADNGGQCPLLQADSTCGWYGNRPMACVRFPEQPNPGCLVWPA